MLCSKCESARYLSDSYCPQCGDQHQTKMTINQCRDIDSEIAKIHEKLPNAEVFTGVMTDTHRYKRILRNKSNNKEVGCWWVTLDDGENKRQLTLSSEDDFLDSLNKGDIITVFRPTPATKTYKVLGKDSKEIVTNDDWAPAVVLHNDKGQRSSLDPIYNPTPRNISSSIFSTLLGSAILMGLLFWFINSQRIYMTMDSFLVIGAVLWGILATLSIRKDKARFEEETELHSTIKHYLKRMLGCQTNELQATHIKRIYQPNDCICPDCDTRIPSSSSYCFKCGSSSNVAPEPTAEANCGSEESTEVTVQQKTTISAQERLIEKVSPALYSEATDYTHKYAIGSATGTLNGHVLFGTVIDRDLTSNINSWTEEQIETTTYKNGYGHTTRTESRVVSSVNHRRSNINGYLVIRTLNGKEYPYNPGSTQLGSTDVGDHVMIGFAEANFGDQDKTSFQQYYFNLTKDDLWQKECITQLDKTGATKAVNLLLLAAAGGLYFYFSANYMQELLVIPYALLGVFGVLCVKAIAAGSANNKARKALADILHDKLNIARNERENWLSWLG
ncbi:hypothetical protein BIT28_01890 [Photobacterium proteolyticum]|uniref:Uncharacterized protein n=1 Tax=Photobacterium proteolyticum TaxID=1903952 RepID=A0A1Q9GVK8_9GAMM|nr:zinc ribbon domain-containing protein [Photobacterium proteolyticum]OLQ79113.1 hypothetical protein BIT28_01890 [Photobacterium proteolyticum]